MTNKPKFTYKAKTKNKKRQSLPIRIFIFRFRDKDIFSPNSDKQTKPKQFISNLIFKKWKEKMNVICTNIVLEAVLNNFVLKKRFEFLNSFVDNYFLFVIF